MGKIREQQESSPLRISKLSLLRGKRVRAPQLRARSAPFNFRFSSLRPIPLSLAPFQLEERAHPLLRPKTTPPFQPAKPWLTKRSACRRVRRRREEDERGKKEKRAPGLFHSSPTRHSSTSTSTQTKKSQQLSASSPATPRPRSSRAPTRASRETPSTRRCPARTSSFGWSTLKVKKERNERNFSVFFSFLQRKKLNFSFSFSNQTSPRGLRRREKVNGPPRPRRLRHHQPGI